MLDPERFHERVLEHIESVNRQLTRLYEAEAARRGPVAEEYVQYALQMRPYIADTGWLVTQALRAGQRVLAEGAQGTLLDLDHGTYPFVTSSSTTAAGALVGLGIGIVPVESRGRRDQGLPNPRRRGALPDRSLWRGRSAPARDGRRTRGMNLAPPPGVRAGWAGWMASCCATRPSPTG